MTTTLNRVTTEAVKKATGKTWDEWIEILDKESAQKLTHKEIALLLFDKGYIKNGWWCQMVTVGYEYSHGHRLAGKTATAGLKLGSRKH